MDIWMKKCKKKSKCSYCGEPVTNGDYMVVGKLWKKVGADHAMHRVYYFRWHVDCWVEQGKKRADEVAENTIDMRSSGRPRLELSDTDRAERNKLLARRSMTIMRIRRAQEANPYDIDRLVRLGTKLHQIDSLLSNVGGLPRSWVKN